MQITATTVPKESAVTEKTKRLSSIIKEGEDSKHNIRHTSILIKGMNLLDRERDLKPRLMLNGCKNCGSALGMRHYHKYPNLNRILFLIAF